MKKLDLRTGDMLEFEDGSKALVMLNTRDGDKYVKVGSGGRYWTHGDLDDREINLKPSLPNTTAGDVVKVYKPKKEYSPLPEQTEYELVWERQEKQTIELDIFINGKEANLSDISEETLLNLRNENYEKI